MAIQEIEKWLKIAVDSFENGDFAKASKWCRKLMEERIAEGFILMAKIHSAKQNYTSVIRTLEQMIEMDPRVPLGWELLSETFIRGGHHQKAMDILTKAIEVCEGKTDSLRIARSSIFVTLRQFEDAIRDLDSVAVESEKMKVTIDILKMSCQNHLGNHEGVLSDLLSLMQRFQAEFPDLKTEGASLYYRILYEKARALSGLGKQSEALLVCHDASRILEPVPEQLLELVREVNAKGLNGEEGTFFRISMVLSTGSSPDRARIYDVLAQSPKEALEFIYEFESDIPGNVLKPSGVQTRACPNKNFLKGIYFRSPVQVSSSRSTSR